VKDITEAQYLELKDKVVNGKKLSEKEIADELGVSTATLWNKKTKWRADKREKATVQTESKGVAKSNQEIDDLLAAKKHLEFNMKDLQSKYENLVNKHDELENENTRLMKALGEQSKEMVNLEEENSQLKLENKQHKIANNHLKEKLDEAVRTREAAADLMIKSKNNIEKKYGDIHIALEVARDDRDVLLKTVRILARDPVEYARRDSRC
jgi:hypothetical protein